MVDAPERLWVQPENRTPIDEDPRHAGPHDVEYVRADLYEQVKRERDEANAMLADAYGSPVDGHKLFAERLAGARVKGELDKLSTFFRDEAPSDGFEGDVEGWSPVDTAIAVMRRNRPAERRVKVGDIVRIIALWSDDEGLELSFNQGDDLARRLLSALAEPAGEVEPVAWRSVDCAPKDGTMLRLLVRPGRAEEDGWTPFADSSDPYQTIGFNALSDTGEDEWQFAGWDWCHDCFTDGAGEVVGWLPFEATPPASAIREALEALLAMAEKQKAYHNTKQHEFPSIEQCTDENGILNPSQNLYALLQGEAYNGRYTEADWWICTIRAEIAALAGSAE